MAGLPCLTSPYAQFSCESKILKNTEYIPGRLSLVVSKGSDAVMMKFVQKFLEGTEGWKSEMKTGKTAFAVG